MRITGSPFGRLTLCTVAAVFIHLVVVLALPRVGRVERSDHEAPLLHVFLEKRVAGPAPEEQPSRQSSRESAQARPSSPSGDELRRVVVSASPKRIPRKDPPVRPSAAELLSQLPEIGDREPKPFALKPEPHSLFKPDPAIPRETDPGLLDEGIWHRARVVRHIRHPTLDGRGVWIKHFDNGDMQVCEKPYDDPFDHGDDYWPFACDRPSQ